MKSLPLLLGLLAVTGAGISAKLYQQLTRAQAAHASELARSESRFQAADAHAAKLSAETGSLRAQVVELDASLGEAKTKLTATEIRNVQLTRELAVARAVPISPERIAAFQATIADLEDQLAQARLTPPVAPAVVEAPRTDAILTTHRSRHASVASVGPSSAFVVLNYGAAHGALPEQQLIIQRGTDELARVLISDVRDQYSIAQVRPDTLRGALHKGDLAVLTE